MIKEFKATTLAKVNKAINKWITEQDKLDKRVFLNGVETKATDVGYSTSINYEIIDKADFINLGLDDIDEAFNDVDFNI